MKLCELILHVGYENVKFQNVQTSMDSVNYTPKGTKITFGTDVIKSSDLISGEWEYVGLVVWLPRNKLPKKGSNES